MQQKQPWLSKLMNSTETNKVILAFIRSQGYQNIPLMELYRILYYLAEENQLLRSEKLQLRNVAFQSKQTLELVLDKIK
ncbi:hypothetical protein [Spartinivicinus ruber]|uniref:hypothetical protein n=1 Tax=Spartinivicinus ruber TaxID=2683272 RepID=UPI0013D74013|nr:hypothetical protein [Spartinivicinus ruber]